MTDSNPVPDAQDIQRRMLAVADARAATSDQPPASASADITMQDSNATTTIDSPTKTWSLHVQLLPHMSADQLALALTTLSNSDSQQTITSERLETPDADLVLHLYDVVLKSLDIKEQLSALEQTRQQSESTLAFARERSQELDQ